MGLMDLLRASRSVTQLTQVQPQQATVEKVWYSSGDISRQPGVSEGMGLGVSTEILTAPVWGSTQPNTFITIEGQPPKAPVIGQIAPILGSNAPVGGK